MKLWGGNYEQEQEPEAGFWEFNRSFPFDRRLVREEIAASRAYVEALAACGALPGEDAARLDAGLAAVLGEVTDPASLDSPGTEDVHSWVEERLAAHVGELAGQAHLARSRNEQAVTALRLWIRGAIDALAAGLAGAVETVAARGREGADALMPGFTHTRAAEPITFGHLAAAWAWTLVRDRQRLTDARRRVNVLPLGSGALAGTPLPLDRAALAARLGFESVSPNALDAVTDRDFATEFVFACAQLQAHLSRIAEDLIWMSGPEFGFFALPDAFTTGSSLMPQKKNPDGLELVRGKTGRVDGALVRLLVAQKGLPTGYQKDLQEDKEAVFDAADTAAASLAVTRGVIGGLVLDKARLEAAAGRDEMLAASLAVALAREGLPFRKAHGVVGALVAEAARSGAPLRDLAARVLSERVPGTKVRPEEVFDARRAVAAKAAAGGTAPAAVRASLTAAVEAAKKG
ncbi:MAG TPA: argininosuccinate lyase [Vicinamibacteria bacterium]|nr:argininosuccinate lyase [Vicinamibacteria bacterium]